MIKPNRDLPINTYNIKDVFQGLEEEKILHKVYGSRDRLEKVLENLKVKIINYEYYMYVDDSDASIVIGLNHLKNSDEKTLHLDIIHELVHIKQLLDGEDLYDKTYSYVDRNTEIEAYKITVEEAIRLKMSREEILDYLKVEWISKKDLIKLAKKLGVI